jgi:hypothetical protein
LLRAPTRIRRKLTHLWIDGSFYFYRILSIHIYIVHLVCELYLISLVDRLVDRLVDMIRI